MKAEVEERLRDLQERLAGVEVSRGAVTLYVATFAPEPYVVRRPIPVVVQQQDEDSFMASFMDANISSAGDTQQEAYSNLKELVLDVFDSLRALPASRLGPKPARQLAVLREFVDAAQDHQGARRKDSQRPPAEPEA